jgi:AcrR family transcriptional regulator
MDKGQLRKSLILRKASILFNKKGYEGANLRQIAKLSGVEGGSVYYYFPSKQHILYEIMDKTMDELLSGIKKAISCEKDSFRKLKSAIIFHIKYHVSKKDEIHVSDWEIRSLTKENYEKIIKKRQEYEYIFNEIIKEGVDRQEMESQTPKMATYATLQMCTGVADWYRDGRRFNLDQVIDRYFVFIKKALSKNS